MKVLHINVSAIRDRFYLTLFSSLKKKGVIQTIYTPYRRCEYNESEFSWVSESYETTNRDNTVSYQNAF